MEERKNKRGGHNKGVPASEETKAKLRAMRKGVPKSQAHKDKIASALIGNTNGKGRTTSEETKVKQRESAIRRGQKPSALALERAAELRRGKPSPRRGVKASKETRAKMSASGIGKRTKEQNHNWKGGITPHNSKIRHSHEYKQWRKAVFERDNYTCQDCKARSEQGKKVVLNADHKLPFALFPELRFNVSNGRTLCEPCHAKTPTYKANSLRIKREEFLIF